MQTRSLVVAQVKLVKDKNSTKMTVIFSKQFKVSVIERKYICKVEFQSNLSLEYAVHAISNEARGFL